MLKYLYNIIRNKQNITWQHRVSEQKQKPATSRSLLYFTLSTIDIITEPKNDERIFLNLFLSLCIAEEKNKLLLLTTPHSPVKRGCPVFEEVYSPVRLSKEIIVEKILVISIFRRLKI